ncbi:hypothetical protein HK103_003209 [Boothiomyces macroporosus]|uniref:DDHD domain-containing protein n=1 Tax=Boothiomyces macroporosus TaxID=261099 RepID=A0AAD5UI74_9FUNG|nr:hypothetical protein HK103_003209 [Boothiomyces macroporosus]
MGSQHNNYGDNLANLRKTCVDTAKEELDLDLNIEWIPIDVLFYFTSYHGQMLINIVTQTVNDTYENFMKEHPDFKGKVSLFCHSLGSIITYDILANQRSSTDSPPEPTFPADTTHFPIVYPKLAFRPDFLFALGSPLSAVMVQRGQSWEKYQIDPRIKYFNIFNLYDPIAYRMEPLIDPRFIEISPVLLQRPSSAATKPFEFSYYKEMIYAYLPDLKLPSLEITKFDFSSMNIEFPSFSAFSGFGVEFPKLPTIPTLSAAQDAFKSQFVSLIPTMFQQDTEDEAKLGSKRKYTDDDTGHAKKKREIQDEEGNVATEHIEENQKANSPSRSLKKNQLRVIKEPTRKSKRNQPLRATSPIEAISEAKERIVSNLSSMIKTYWQTTPKSPKKNKNYIHHLEKNVNHLGDALTKELVAAAAETKARIQKEHDEKKRKPEHSRVDYFVQENLIDNMLHQVIHFNPVYDWG